MDDMNIQNAPSENSVAVAANTPAVENKVINGDSSKNIGGDRQAIADAKKLMFGGGKSEVQGKPIPAAVESKGEEPVIEAEPANESIIPKSDDRLIRAREKDKKQISKLTAQKYALKEENSRLQAEIEKFKTKMANEPQVEDFPDESAYNRAKIRYDIEMENGVERFQAAEKQLETKRHDEWTERCQSTVKDFKTFSDNYTKYYEWLSNNEPELMNFASQSIVGPRMIEEAFDDLFKSEQGYSKWKGMSRHGRVQLLTQIEAGLLRELDGGHQPQTTAPAPVQKSNAPTPIAPEKASEKVAPKAVTLKDQIARSKARMFG